MKNRKLEEQIFNALMLASTLIVVGSLLAVIGVVIVKGAPALSLSMITQTSSGGFYLGGAGGILNAIVGSLYLISASISLAFVIGLPVALYLNEYAARSKSADFVRLCLDVLYGVPSIVYGAFAFTTHAHPRSPCISSLGNNHDYPTCHSHHDSRHRRDHKNGTCQTERSVILARSN